MFELVNNALIGEQITKLVFCRLIEGFVALRYQGYITRFVLLIMNIGIKTENYLDV